MNIKCEDYFIIKLRNYADARLLKKWELAHDSNSQTPLPAQHHERARLHNEFFWDFVKQITGKDMVSWHKEYVFDIKECLKDEIQESHGILILDGEGWVRYFIPLKHVWLIKWFKNNITVPAKILKRTNTRALHWRDEVVDKTRRIKSKEHGIEFIKKHNLKLE